jgi:hypothetical protein
MIMSFVFGVVKPKLLLIVSILLITVGIASAVASTTEIDPIGVIMVLGASVVGAIRLVVLQKVLQSGDYNEQENSVLNNPQEFDENFDIFENDYEIKEKKETKPSTFLVYFYIMMSLSISILPFSIILGFFFIF